MSLSFWFSMASYFICIVTKLFVFFNSYLPLSNNFLNTYFQGQNKNWHFTWKSKNWSYQPQKKHFYVFFCLELQVRGLYKKKNKNGDIAFWHIHLNGIKFFYVQNISFFCIISYTLDYLFIQNLKISTKKLLFSLYVFVKLALKFDFPISNSSKNKQ